jgi:hypothetical protein
MMVEQIQSKYSKSQSQASKQVTQGFSVSMISWYAPRTLAYAPPWQV